MTDSDKASTTECIYFKEGEYYCRYMYSDIYWISVSGRYSNIHLSSDRAHKLSLPITLTELMKFLPTSIFIRIHRSYIVNANYIERISGNMLYIGTAVLPIGREYKKAVYSHLNIVGLLPDK